MGQQGLVYSVVILTHFSGFSALRHVQCFGKPFSVVSPMVLIITPYLQASCLCPIIVLIASNYVKTPLLILMACFSPVELLWVLEEMRVENGKICFPSYVLMRCAQIASVALGIRTQ